MPASWLAVSLPLVCRSSRVDRSRLARTGPTIGPDTDSRCQRPVVSGRMPFTEKLLRTPGVTEVAGRLTPVPESANQAAPAAAGWPR
jgi:hypothetical protein